MCLGQAPSCFVLAHRHQNHHLSFIIKLPFIARLYQAFTYMHYILFHTIVLTVIR